MSIIVGLSSICGTLFSCKPLLEGSSTFEGVGQCWPTWQMQARFDSHKAQRCLLTLPHMMVWCNLAQARCQDTVHPMVQSPGPSFTQLIQSITSHDSCVSHAQPIAKHTTDALEYL